MLVTKTDMQQSSANQLLPTNMHVQEHRHTHTCLHAHQLGYLLSLILPYWLTDRHMDGWRWLLACHDQWSVCVQCVCSIE